MDQEVKHPTFGNGKICYLEIPARDVQVSAAFYQNVFGWHIRSDDQGHVSFDDGVKEVSGMWILDRKPVSDPGIVISIMVDNAAATVDLITGHGGQVINTQKLDSGEEIATFIDPAGNLMGIYQSARISK
jgi:predicted enzyme related to lactoylglutathione lyase